MARENKFSDTANHETLISLLLSLLIEYGGYRLISKRQKSKDIRRLGITARVPLVGSELGLEYLQNGHRAFVWTSWDPIRKTFREVGTDVFWAGIARTDELVYCSKPVSRIDEESVIKLARQAWINRWRVEHLPLCMVCHAQMEIYRKPYSRQYMYVCKRSDQHKSAAAPEGRWLFQAWDKGLGPKAKDFLASVRAATQRYKARCAQAGVAPIPKAVTRNKWVWTSGKKSS